MTRADGSVRWVDMPEAGAETYTQVRSPLLNMCFEEAGVSGCVLFPVQAVWLPCPQCRSL